MVHDVIPIIHHFFSYLQNPEDMWKLVRGVRALLRIAHAEPLAAHLDHTSTREDLDHQLHFKSDVEIAELVKDRVQTVYHPTSTCRMAPREEGGVVDAKLRVYGIHGLRVCDASIFPSIISGHTVRMMSISLQVKYSWPESRPVDALPLQRNLQTT